MYSLAHWAASLPINLYVLRVLLDCKIVSLVVIQMYYFEMIGNFIRKRNSFENSNWYHIIFIIWEKSDLLSGNDHYLLCRTKVEKKKSWMMQILIDTFIYHKTFIFLLVNQSSGNYQNHPLCNKNSWRIKQFLRCIFHFNESKAVYRCFLRQNWIS